MLEICIINVEKMSTTCYEEYKQIVCSTFTMILFYKKKCMLYILTCRINNTSQKNPIKLVYFIFTVVPFPI